MRRRVMFGVVIGEVFLAGVPFDVELVPCNLVGDPKVSHFHGSRALALDGVVSNAGGGGVITMDWSCWLLVSEFV